MDICYHLIHEYNEDGMVEIKFVKSEENDADLFMKNSPGNPTIYERSVVKKICFSPWTTEGDSYS